MVQRFAFAVRSRSRYDVRVKHVAMVLILAACERAVPLEPEPSPRPPPVPVVPTTPQRAFLGVHYTDLVDGVRTRGAEVVGVIPGTPAERVGIAIGDVVIAYDNEVLDQQAELGLLVSRSRPGHVAALTLDRQGTTLTIRAELIAGSAE